MKIAGVLKPRVESVGVDAGEVIRRTARKMLERHEEAERRAHEESFRWKYETRETIYVVVRELPRRRDSEPKRYIAGTIAELPHVGVVKSVQPESSPSLAIIELRLELARLWWRHRCCKSFDEARERSAKADLVEELIV